MGDAGIVTWLLGGGGAALIFGFIGALFNNLFGLAKTRADVDRSKAQTAEIFNKLAADAAQRDAKRQAALEIRLTKIIAALDELLDAVDNLVPFLMALSSPEILPEDTRELVSELRRTAQQARLAM